MTGRSVLLWVVLPFLVLCGLVLWWTRPPPPAGPEPAPTPLAGAPPSEPLPGHEPRVLAPPPAFPSSRESPLGLPQGTPASALAQPQPQEAPPPPDEAALEARVAQATQDPLAREELRQAARALRPLLRQCFEDVASRHPGPQSATLRFTLESSPDASGHGGRLRGELLDASVQDPLLRACLEDSLLDARLPAPRRAEGLTLTYPYRLRPTPQPGRVDSLGAKAEAPGGEPASGR